MKRQKLWPFLFLLSFLALPLAAQTTAIRGRVTLPEGDPLPGVTVTADDFGITAITDAEGRYVLSIPSDRIKGPLKVTASLAGFQTRSDVVNASGGEATANFTLRVSFGEQITVGSRAIGAEREKAVPVDVIPEAQIESSPSTEVSQIIQKIAPSFNFPRPGLADGTDTIRPATLRGL